MLTSLAPAQVVRVCEDTDRPTDRLSDCLTGVIVCLSGWICVPLYIIHVKIHECYIMDNAQTYPEHEPEGKISSTPGPKRTQYSHTLNSHPMLHPAPTRTQLWWRSPANKPERRWAIDFFNLATPSLTLLSGRGLCVCIKVCACVCTCTCTQCNRRCMWGDFCMRGGIDMYYVCLFALCLYAWCLSVDENM